MAFSLRTFTLTSWSVISLVSLAYGLEPIIARGTKFYTSNGTQFIVKGLFYRTLQDQVSGDLASFVDPLTDEKVCERDIRLIRNLGINTIVINAFNADREHQRCMQQLSDAGIYVLPAINGYTEVAYQYNGTVGTPVTYVAVKHFFRAVDFFRKWNNTLGLMFFIQDVTDIAAGLLPIQKRYLGETKEYIRSRGYRDIPIGVVGNEWVPKRYNVPQYMACDKEDTAADFYVTWPRASDFETWCSNSSTRFDDLRDRFGDFPRPLILSHGCRVGKTHDFREVQEIFGPQTAVLHAGAVFHEWFEHSYTSNEMFDWSNLVPSGLVHINQTNVTLNPAYSALSSQLAAATPVLTRLSDSTQERRQLECGEVTLKKGEPTNVTEDMTIKSVIPVRSSTRLCNCMMETLSCTPNLDSTLQSHSERVWDTLRQLCLLQPSDPAACHGWRHESDKGLFDSFVHCNDTEKVAWVYDRLSNSSDTCTAIDGLARQPTPSPSLAPDCQELLRQAGPAGTGTVTYFPAAAATSISTTTAGARKDGLSSGGKAGIGFAVAGCILVAIGGILFYRRTKRKAAARKRMEAERALEDEKALEASRFQKVELPGSAVSTAPIIAQLHSNEIYELESPDSAPVEVAGDASFAAELETHEPMMPELEASQTTSTVTPTTPTVDTIVKNG